MGGSFSRKHFDVILVVVGQTMTFGHATGGGGFPRPMKRLPPFVRGVFPFSISLGQVETFFSPCLWTLLLRYVTLFGGGKKNDVSPQVGIFCSNGWVRFKRAVDGSMRQHHLSGFSRVCLYAMVQFG